MSALAPLEMTAWIAGICVAGVAVLPLVSVPVAPSVSRRPAARTPAHARPAAWSPPRRRSARTATRREDGAGTAAEVRAGLLDDRGHEPQEIPVAAPSTAARPVTPRRPPPAAGPHHVLNDQLAGRLPPLVPGFTRCRIQLPSRPCLRHFVSLSYGCRGLPALAEVGDVSRMRQHVSDSLKRRRHTQTSPSAQRGPMSNRDSQNHTGPSGY
jgi:hypothetical protein